MWPLSPNWIPVLCSFPPPSIPRDARRAQDEPRGSDTQPLLLGLRAPGPLFRDPEFTFRRTPAFDLAASPPGTWSPGSTLPPAPSIPPSLHPSPPPPESQELGAGRGAASRSSPHSKWLGRLAALIRTETRRCPGGPPRQPPPRAPPPPAASPSPPLPRLSGRGRVKITARPRRPAGRALFPTFLHSRPRRFFLGGVGWEEGRGGASLEVTVRGSRAKSLPWLGGAPGVHYTASSRALGQPGRRAAGAGSELDADVFSLLSAISPFPGV